MIEATSLLGILRQVVTVRKVLALLAAETSNSKHRTSTEQQGAEESSRDQQGAAETSREQEGAAERRRVQQRAA